MKIQSLEPAVSRVRAWHHIGLSSAPARGRSRASVPSFHPGGPSSTCVRVSSGARDPDASSYHHGGSFFESALEDFSGCTPTECFVPPLMVGAQAENSLSPVLLARKINLPLSLVAIDSHEPRQVRYNPQASDRFPAF